MRKFLLFLALATLLSGCVTYRGGSLSGDFAGNEPTSGRGTSGVSSGADPGPEITGSTDVPAR